MRSFGELTWANSAAADTQATVDVPAMKRGPGQTHTVSVRNPSAVTALTVRLYTLVNFSADENDDSQEEYVYLTEFAIAASETKQFVIEGWLAGFGGRIVASNDTVLGAGDGFTAAVVTRRV